MQRLSYVGLQKLKPIAFYMTLFLAIALGLHFFSMAVEMMLHWQDNVTLTIVNAYAFMLSINGIMHFAARGNYIDGEYIAEDSRSGRNYFSRMNRSIWVFVTLGIVEIINYLGNLFNMTVWEEYWLFYCNIAVSESLYYAVLLPNSILAGLCAENIPAGIAQIFGVVTFAVLNAITPQTMVWYKGLFSLAAGGIFSLFARFASITRFRTFKDKNRYNKWEGPSNKKNVVAIIIPAIVFMCAHIDVDISDPATLYFIIPTVSVFYSLGYIMTRDPLVPVLAHVLNNFGAAPAVIAAAGVMNASVVIGDPVYPSWPWLNLIIAGGCIIIVIIIKRIAARRAFIQACTARGDMTCR